MFCQELAVQLTRDVLPALGDKGVKLFMVSIGTKEVSEVGGSGLEMRYGQQRGGRASRLLQLPAEQASLALGNQLGLPRSLWPGRPLGCMLLRRLRRSLCPAAVPCCRMLLCPRCRRGGWRLPRSP